MLAAQPQVMPFLVPTRPTQGQSNIRAIGVLLLNDGQITFDPLKVTLSSAGYDVHSVLTAKEAFYSLQSRRPDLVIINLGLQDKDGRHLVEDLRHSTTAPIIVMSVRQEESEKVSCLDTGADDYLTRPFATAQLLARLRAALRRAF